MAPLYPPVRQWLSEEMRLVCAAKGPEFYNSVMRPHQRADGTVPMIRELPDSTLIAFYNQWGFRQFPWNRQ